MRESKKYWLAPIIIALVLVGVLLVIAKSSALEKKRRTPHPTGARTRLPRPR